MINQLKEEIAQLPEDHPFHQLKEWHLRQCIRQIRERAKKTMIPPFSRIETYRGQGMMVSKLYTVLLSHNTSTIQEFLKDLTFGDVRKLMWQRFTSSSYTSDQYFLPTPEELEGIVENQDIASLLDQLQNKSGSCDEGYWDIALHEARERSVESGKSVMLEILDFFIDEFTWWNTYQKEDLCLLELRDPSGHGIRFDLDTSVLISFVEPDEDGIEFKMSRD